MCFFAGHLGSRSYITRAASTPLIARTLSSTAGVDRAIGVDERVGVFAAGLVQQLGDVQRARRPAAVEIWPTMLGTLLLAMQMREVFGARGSTTSGKLTLFLMLPFSR